MATKATADRLAVAYAVQSDFDTVATTGFKYARIRSDNATRPDQTTQSQELRTDRQVVDRVPTSQHSELGFSCELSYQGHDDFIKAALEAADSSVSKNVDSVAAAGTANTFSATGIETDLTVGDWVRGYGFAESANNGWHRVTAVGTNQITVGSTLVTEAAASGQRIVLSSKIWNGTTPRFWTVYRSYNDLSNVHARHVGMRFTSWGLNVSGRDIITHEFGTMGKLETTETSGPSSPTAAATNPVMRGRDSVEAVYVNNSKIGTTSLSFSLNNNGRVLDQDVGNGADPCGVNLGKLAVEGSHEGYYETAAVLDLAFARSVAPIALAAADELGNGYLIEMPRVRLGSPTRPATGENTDILASASFAAMLDPTTGHTIRVFGATVPS